MNVLPYWSDAAVRDVADRLRDRGRLFPMNADTVRSVLHEAEALPIERNTLSGAPECSCGWDEAYTEVSAAVRSGALVLPRTDQTTEADHG